MSTPTERRTATVAHARAAYQICGSEATRAAAALERLVATHRAAARPVDGS